MADPGRDGETGWGRRTSESPIVRDVRTVPSSGRLRRSRRATPLVRSGDVDVPHSASTIASLRFSMVAVEMAQEAGDAARADSMNRVRRFATHALATGLLIFGLVTITLAVGSRPASAVASNAPVVGMVSTPSGQGYWLAASDGGVFAFGDAGFFGSMGGTPLNRPIVGMAASPFGNGYWLVASDGGVFAFGNATYYGSLGGVALNAPIVGMAPAPLGLGYWLVASDGGVFAFGSAGFFGSMGESPLNAPIVGMAASPFGNGYWLVAGDGGVFAFGAARFHGSMGGVVLARPIVGMAAAPFGLGYWMVASDGGLFAFGDAGFFGSLGATALNRPITGVSVSPDSQGYWMVASDGGIFAFGDAGFTGSVPGLPPPTEPSPPLPPIPQPPSDATCTATMSNPTPGDYQYDTVNVSSNTPNASFAVIEYFLTTTTYYDGATDANGSASIPLYTSSAVISVPVEVEVDIIGGSTCATFYTPQ